MVILAELRTDDGTIVGLLMVRPKDFRTGSRGFYGNAKLEIKGKRYQTQVQLIELGSKHSKPENAPVAAPKRARSGVKSRRG